MLLMSNDKRRLFFVDIMRIVCVFLIYMRHSITMFGCSFGQWTNGLILEMTSPVMTCFFILSGFSIHYQHGSEEITAGWTRAYIKKKLISIMPSYFLVALIWPVVYPDQFRTWALLLPIDLVGAQTTYRTLFGILHNGGTWFVSCLLLAYLLYPSMKAVLAERKRAAIVVLVFTHFILMYSHLIIREFSLDKLYSNPIARTAEFLIGVAFAEALFFQASTIDDHSTKQSVDRRNKNRNIGLVILVLLLISVILSIAFHEGKRVSVFTFFPVPGILIGLWISATAHCDFFENNKIISMLSAISYQFFLMQLFLWKLSAFVLKVMGVEDINVIKLVVSFVLCLTLSYLVWRLYDKPIRGFLSKKLLS